MLCQLTLFFFFAEMGLLDFIRTADPRKVHAVEVEKRPEQKKLADVIKDSFVSLDEPFAGMGRASGAGGSGVATAGGSGISAAGGSGVSVAGGSGTATAGGSGVSPVVSEAARTENVAEDSNVDLENVVVVDEDAAPERVVKAKRRKPLRDADTLPAKKLRADHASLTSATGGKTLAGLQRLRSEGTLPLDSTFDVEAFFSVPRCYIYIYIFFFCYAWHV